MVWTHWVGGRYESYRLARRNLEAKFMSSRTTNLTLLFVSFLLRAVSCDTNEVSRFWGGSCHLSMICINGILNMKF